MSKPTAVLFSHPSAKVRAPLKVHVKPNQIEWTYGLNTQNYPTYGGEVIQILSCYIDDLTVAGNVTSYREMEKIYKWFIEYIQLATAGKRGRGSYDTRPVIMKYPERGWTFHIYPKSLPSFKYGRDIVAPEWTMTAAIAEPDQDFKLKVLDKALQEAAEAQGDFKLFGSVTADMGFNASNPFSDPDAQPKADKQLKKHPNTGANDYGDLADWYNNLLPSYLNGDFRDISADYSRPSFITATTDQAKKQVDKIK